MNVFGFLLSFQKNNKTPIMKKLIFALNLLAFFCLSCSSDESQNNPLFLVKKIVSTTPGSQPLTFSYSYQGNKLVKINPSQNLNVVNTYTGNLITHVKQYYTGGPLLTEGFNEYDSQGRIAVDKIFIYTNGENYGSKRVYTYNPDNTVTYQSFLGTSASQTTPGTTGKIWLNSNGEELKTEEYANGVLIRRVVNTYDDKNSAFKNAVGFNKFYGGENTTTHNILTSATYDENGHQIMGYTNVYTYNESGYPITRETLMFNSNSPDSSQFFYE